MKTVTRYMRGRLLNEDELELAVGQIQEKLDLFNISMTDTIEGLDKMHDNTNMKGDYYDIILTFEARKTDAKEHTNV